MKVHPSHKTRFSLDSSFYDEVCEYCGEGEHPLGSLHLPCPDAPEKPMTEESRQLKGFLDAIAANPRDLTTRLVLADWYDEHDEPELADEQRKFNLKKYDAEQYLIAFQKRYDPYEKDYKALVQGALEGSYSFSDDDGPYEARTKEFWEAIEIITEKEMTNYHRENARFSCGC